jgi:hypothetical protein
MNWFKNLFSSPPKPQLSIKIDGFGDLNYDNDSESWIAIINSTKFHISYEGENIPNSDLIQYAKRVSNDLKSILLYVNSEFDKHKIKYPNHSDDLKNPEIDFISINRYDDEIWFMIFFIPKYIDRSWRFEAHGDKYERQCLGYDS